MKFAKRRLCPFGPKSSWLCRLDREKEMQLAWLPLLPKAIRNRYLYIFPPISLFPLFSPYFYISRSGSP
jgi:hypothetical protein